MYAVVNSKGLVAKDFRTRPEALAWIKHYNDPTLRIINQNTQKFRSYERR
jgi:hypothetical protein